jgi:hypothetical protein
MSLLTPMSSFHDKRLVRKLRLWVELGPRARADECGHEIGGPDLIVSSTLCSIKVDCANQQRKLILENFPNRSSRRLIYDSEPNVTHICPTL